jgi:hypothetical protein
MMNRPVRSGVPRVPLHGNHPLGTDVTLPAQKRIIPSGMDREVVTFMIYGRRLKGGRLLEVPVKRFPEDPLAVIVMELVLLVDSAVVP